MASNEITLSEETLEQIQEYILQQLPAVLEKDPNFVRMIEGILAEKFPRRDEFAQLLAEMRQFRQEVNQRFEQVDQHFEQVDQRFEQVDQRFDRIEDAIHQHRQETAQRFDQVDQRFEQVDQTIRDLQTEMRTGFDEVHRSIDRLGARWGIRTEKIFRQTMRTLLEESFGARVEERYIEGEQFDVISNGLHILIEIAASAKRNILQRLQRKRQLYAEETGVAPSRFLFVVGDIHSRRVQQLREAGFDVVEPEFDENDEEIIEL